MAFDLHLELRGLCALVPNQPLPTSPSTAFTVDRMRVILVDVRSETTIAGVTVCAHAPFLEVQTGGTPTRIDLISHEIQITGVDNSSAAAKVKLQPTFWLAAQMLRVRPTFKVDDLLFSNPPGHSMAARLQLTAAKAFGIDPSPQTITFPTTPPYTGNFVLGVRLEIPITGTQGTFTVTPFTGGTPQTVTFGPGTDGKAHATLSNICDPADLKDGDNDFVAFYTLEEELRPPVVLPVAAPPPGLVFGSATRAGETCIPAVTNDNSLA